MYSHDNTFQSTLPMRGATSNPLVIDTCTPDFNPHSPCGERRVCKSVRGHDMAFQSTLPMRGATYHAVAALERIQFQSTLPMRGATAADGICRTANRFQSTLPMRGATLLLRRPQGEGRISIHTPHAGSDELRLYRPVRSHLFQSTLPMRGATSPRFRPH